MLIKIRREIRHGQQRSSTATASPTAAAQARSTDTKTKTKNSSSASPAEQQRRKHGRRPAGETTRPTATACPTTCTRATCPEIVGTCYTCQGQPWHRQPLPTPSSSPGTETTPSRHRLPMQQRKEGRKGERKIFEKIRCFFICADLPCRSSRNFCAAPCSPPALLLQLRLHLEAGKMA